MEAKLAKIIQDVFGVNCEVNLTRTDPKFGDYASNVAIRLSRQLHKSPREIAEILLLPLRESDSFGDVSIADNGFLNFRLRASQLAASLEANWSASYGQSDDGAGRLAIVEFPSPNMAKPYSVGHLRPANQGWAAKRLLEMTGWEVITDNHLGDYGAPFGIWVVGYLKFSSPDRLDQGGVYELGRVYVLTKQALEQEKARGDTDLADSVQEWLLKLERGDEEAKEYSARFNRISLEHMHKVMARLKIATDYELGESFFVERGKRAVTDLLARGIAIRNDDGSVVVPLDDQGIDVPFLILKSNGAALYATTDLATLLYREEQWHPSKVVYAVGAEQQFYFRQLFALARKLGLKTDFVHLWFGTIDQVGPGGKREKMSSRKGVVLLEELLDQAEAKAKSMVSGEIVSEEDVKKIALGAIKFSDFTADRRTNILFDWDSIFALTGFSGPYVQYAAVRVNKILNDYADEPATYQSGYDYEAEKELLLLLAEFPATVGRAATELEPHRIAAYLYALAKQLNRYYEATPIATGQISDIEKSARLDLLAKIASVLRAGFDVLGIEIPDRM